MAVTMQTQTGSASAPQRAPLWRLALLFLFFMFSGANAMASKVMFSEVQGVVLKNGAPVAGAKIKREYTWAWDNKKVTEDAVSDAAGKFAFSQASKSSFMSGLMPHEPVISQLITISFEGKEYIAWDFRKHNYDNNGELKGKPIKISCELTRKPASSYINDDIYGICSLM
ncbi:MAG: hypothetical protein HYZ45_07515 [Burkholderiales bacterium]|nr:hypothetical protein [Burkholderiales bacterium]